MGKPLSHIRQILRRYRRPYMIVLFPFPTLRVFILLGQERTLGQFILYNSC